MMKRLLVCVSVGAMLAATLATATPSAQADSTGTLEEASGWTNFAPAGVLDHNTETINKLYGASSLHLFSTARFSGTWVAVRKSGLSIDDPRFIQFWMNGVNGAEIDVKVASSNGTYGQHHIKFSKTGWDYIEFPIDSMSLYGTNVDAGTTPYLSDVASIEFAVWTDWLGTGPGQIDWYIDALKIQTGYTMEEQNAWGVITADPNVFNAGPDASVDHLGNSTLKMVSAQRQPAGWWTGTSFDGFRVENATTIRFRLRTDNVTPLDVKISTGDGTFADALVYGSGTGEWEEVVLSIPAMHSWGTRVTLGQQPYIHQVNLIEFLVYTPYMGSTPGTQTWWVDDLEIDDSLDEQNGWTAFGPNTNVMATSYDTDRYEKGTRSLAAVSAQRWTGEAGWIGVSKTGLSIEHADAIEIRGSFVQNQPLWVKLTDIAGTRSGIHLLPLTNSDFTYLKIPLSKFDTGVGQPKLTDVGTIDFITYTGFMTPVVGEVTWLFDEIDFITYTDYTMPLSRWSAPTPVLNNTYGSGEVTLDEQAGWTAFAPTTSILDVAASTGTKKYGDASLRIFSTTRDPAQNNWVGARKTSMGVTLPVRSVQFWLYSPNGTNIDVKLTTTNGTFAEITVEPDHSGWTMVDLPIEDFTTWGTNVTNQSEPYIDDVATIELLMHSSWMGTGPGTLDWFVDDLRVFTSTSHQLSFVMHDIWHDEDPNVVINPDIVDPQILIDTVDEISTELYPPANLRISLVHRGFGDEIDTTDPVWIADMKAPIDWMKDNNIEPWVETHLQPFPYQYLEDNDLTYKDELGRTLDLVDALFGLFHGHDLANPVVVDAVADKAVVTPSVLGANGITDIDYVWASPGGLGWGYSDAAKATWKQILQGLDGGIELTDGTTMRFWDYFDDYNGFTYVPGDLGYANWGQYEPQPGVPDTAAGKRNQFVENMLYHYQWLRAAADVGEEVEAADGELNLVLNPEFTGSGTDLFYVAQAEHLGMPVLEQWYTPDVMEANYLAANYYATQYDANDKRIGLVSETIAAGGNPFASPPRPHYWDNEANYLINYTLQGIWNFDVHEENYWGAPYDLMSDPLNNDWYVTYVGHLASLNGTLRAAEEQVTQPGTDVLSIVSRAVTGHEAVPHERGGDTQAFNLAQTLSANHYRYDQAGLPLGAIALDDYETVLYSARETPVGFFDDLRDWLDGASGRTLVTHSFIPKREIDGVSVYDADPTAIYSGVDGDTTLGLGTVTQTSVSSGTISAVDSGFAPFLDLDVGDPIDFPNDLTVATNGTALLSVGGNDLVTEVTVGGSRVIYLNFVPVDLDVYPAAGATQQRIIDAVMRYLGETPFGASEPGEYTLMKLDKPGAEAVFTIVDASSMENFPEFEARDVHATGSIDVFMAPSTQYEIEDVLTGTTWLATSNGSGRLTIDMDGWAMRVVEIRLP